MIPLRFMRSLECQPFANQLSELPTPARLKRDQHLIDRARFVQCSALFMQLVDSDLAIDVVEVDQKFVRMFGLDIEWLKRLFWKVFEIVSDDYFARCLDRRCQHMPILFMIGHNGNQFAVSWLNPRVREMQT
jgi:hypothetical protein